MSRRQPPGGYVKKRPFSAAFSWFLSPDWGTGFAGFCNFAGIFAGNTYYVNKKEAFTRERTTICRHSHFLEKTQIVVGISRKMPVDKTVERVDNFFTFRIQLLLWSTNACSIACCCLQALSRRHANLRCPVDADGQKKRYCSGRLRCEAGWRLRLC